jgi:hypothetical protein
LSELFLIRGGATTWKIVITWHDRANKAQGQPICHLITIFGTTSVYTPFTRDYLNLAATWTASYSIVHKMPDLEVSLTLLGRAVQRAVQSLCTAVHSHFVK